MFEDRSVGEKVIYNQYIKHVLSCLLKVQLIITHIPFTNYALLNRKKERWCHKPRGQGLSNKGGETKVTILA